MTKPFERLVKIPKRVTKPFERLVKVSERVTKPFERLGQICERVTKPFERLGKICERMTKTFRRGGIKRILTSFFLLADKNLNSFNLNGHTFNRVSSTDSKVRTTLYGKTNSTTGKYCLIAFICYEWSHFRVLSTAQ